LKWARAAAHVVGNYMSGYGTLGSGILQCGIVRSTLHPAWAVLAKVHAGVACMRGVFQALVDRLTKSGLRQLEAGANQLQSVIGTRRV